MSVASRPLNLYEVWSLPGVFLFHCLFLFAEIADVLIWFSSVCLTKLSVRYADMARVQFPTRQPCLFPFDRGLCIISALLIPSSQNLCPRGFLLKHRQGVSNGRHTDGSVKMKHKLRSWTLIEETVPNAWSLQKTSVHRAFCCAWNKTCLFFLYRKGFYLGQKDKLMLFLFPLLWALLFPVTFSLLHVSKLTSC